MERGGLIQGGALAIVHCIIGTAGHIDHGKTSLVKALTGQDTDRLKEEKERGISIDLGFAHLDLPGDLRAGVVDVPGHERFIKNMLAGAHGMDLVLFTVAADDGVMPQTEEHLDILHLLGVRRAIFAITKADRVLPGRIAEVNEQIRALVAGSLLEGSPAIPVSVVSGEGLDRLRDRIAVMLRDDVAPLPASRFRLPVDRAFVSSGHGLIVTGTAIGGEVRPGDTVRCLPGSDLLRVRSVEVHNATVDVASRGQRIALNVTGAGRESLARGDVLCDPAVTLITSRFDAKLELRPRAHSGVKDHQKIRVHVGTAERLGRAIPLTSGAQAWPDGLAPGQTGFCQIVLEEPVHMLRGDRFIIRDETAQRTLGGGVVVHPLASKHKRSDVDLIEVLRAFERGDEAVFVRALTEERGEFAVPLADLAQLSSRREEAIRQGLQSSRDVHVFADGADVQYAPEESCRGIRISILEFLRRWHADHPMMPGAPLEEARASLATRVPQAIFRMLVDELVAEGLVTRDANVLALPTHRAAIPEADRALVERIRALLERTPMTPPDLQQLTVDLGINRKKLTEILGAMERQVMIVSVAPDLYFLHDAIDRTRNDLIQRLTTKDGITAGEFRDQYKTSRKYAIPLLEYFDRTGITIRKGDVRHLRRPMRSQAEKA
jgi:selenocysteine-specific elongation factor